MRHTFRYRLRDDALLEDHVLQSVLFRDLVHQQPALTCATYEVGSHDRVLLVDIDDIGRIRGVLPLAYYLDRLGQRCEDGPDHAELADDSPDGPAAIHLVGCWDPAHEQWCVPYRGWPYGADPAS